MAYLEFHGTDWQGAEPDASEPRGFKCPGIPVLECFGQTGTQVLDSLGANFKSISSENTLAEDVAVMVVVEGRMIQDSVHDHPRSLVLA